MNFRAPSHQHKAEIVVVTPSFASPEGGAGQVASELITTIFRRSPFHFTWAAQERIPPAGAVVPEMFHHNPSLYTLLPMRGGNFLKNMLGIRWPI